jgi:hypothetical protein
MNEDEFVSTGWHWQYGWLRRPELDGEEGYCYEDPEGDLVYTQHPRHRKHMRLTCWQDSECGETYLAISHVPCGAPKYER